MKKAVAVDSPEAALHLLLTLKSPWDKDEMLKAAEEKFPDTPALLRARLMLGDVSALPRGTYEYRVVKCYILHALECPEEYTAEEARARTREIFDHPQLKKCLALSSDKAGFLRDYLREMTEEYARIFIFSARKNRPSMAFGKARYAGVCVPCAKVLRGIFASPDLSEEEKKSLSGAFYRSAVQLLCDPAPLDKELSQEEKARIE